MRLAVPTLIVVVLLGVFAGRDELFVNSAQATGCGLTQAAFCDTFDQPQNGGTRSGDLNPVVWGVSRLTGNVNAGQGVLNGWFAADVQACDGSHHVQPPGDVIICNGQMREVTNDGHQVTTLAMYPKQPFDFAGRTGKVVFDVSNDTLNTHDAWPEFWLSDKPSPAPFNHFDSWQTLPRHGLAVRFGSGVGPGGYGYCPNGNNLDKQRWTVDSVAVVRDYVLDDTNGFGPRQVTFKVLDCVTAGSPGAMNHVELDISQNQIDVYATDAGATTLKHIAVANNVNLTLSRGLIWLEDVHYNAEKACCNDQGPHRNHTFAWDNVGFDGPFTYHDLSFDALDSLVPGNADGSIDLGKVAQANATTSWDVLGMPANPQAEAVRVLFNFQAPTSTPIALNVVVNGHAHAVPWPYPDAVWGTWHTLDVLVPITELVPGTNKVQIGGDQGMVVSNVNVVLVNAGASTPVSTATSTSTNTPVVTQTPTSTPVPASGACTFKLGGTAAFCEDGKASPGGRAGDLDDSRWSVGRVDGEYAPPNMMPFPSVAARCKAGNVSPDNDIFSCGSGFETALGAQNYALLSMRPRQAFDFTNRSGVISYNVDAATGSPQGWWHSVYVTQDPVPGAANTSQVSGMTPRNGVGVNFDGNNCSGNLGTSVRVNNAFTFNDYAETSVPFNNSVCIQTKAGSQNHIEIKLSTSRIEVWASDFSPDGVTFPNWRMIGSAPLSLNFSQGYVHFQHGQRAPGKYFNTPSSNYLWSGMSFDGPVVAQETAYVVPDALTPNGSKLNIGYGLNTPFNLGNVAGGSGKLTFSILYVNDSTHNSSTYAAKYRFNGGAWQSISAEYANALRCQAWGGNTDCNWSMGFSVPVTVPGGPTTVEIASDGVSAGYPPILANVELLTYGQTVTPIPTQTGTPVPVTGLHVVGNQLVDGSPVQLRGVSRSGGEYMCSSGSSDSFDGPTDQASIDAIKAWGVNVVRVSMNEDCWLGINGIPTNMTVDKYRQQVKAFVDLLSANGLYVILDLHWNAPGTQQSTGQMPMPDMDHTPAFWTSIAQTFGNYPNVLFDLFNEPFPDNNQDTTAAWTCLRDGGTCPGVSYQAAGMQTLVNTVRATGAKNVIMSPGILYAGGASRWLEFKPNDSTGNLAASWHTYKPNSNQCNTQACWDSVLAPIAASVPLIAGEIGQTDCASDYIVPLMTWLDQHKANYLAWAWDVYDCGGFPSLVSDYSGTPTNYGIGFRDHLLGVVPTATATNTPQPTQTPTVAPTATFTPTVAPTAQPIQVPAPPASGCFTLTAQDGVVDRSWKPCL